MDAPEKRIAQHRNVIEAAKGAGVSTIVYTSIQGAEENVSQAARQADMSRQGMPHSPLLRNSRMSKRNIYITESVVMRLSAEFAAAGLQNYTGNTELSRMAL